MQGVAGLVESFKRNTKTMKCRVHVTYLVNGELPSFCIEPFLQLNYN